MSTPQKTIDLSKCKVGQRVRLRNGEEATIKEIANGNSVYRFLIRWTGGEFDWVTSKGKCWRNCDSPSDIVAILPPAKKAAKKPAKKGATNKQWEAGKAKILRILDELEGLLKPCGKVGKPAHRRR